MMAFMRNNKFSEKRFSRHANYTEEQLMNQEIDLEDEGTNEEEGFNIPIAEVQENEVIKMFAQEQEGLQRKINCYIVSE